MPIHSIYVPKNIYKKYVEREAKRRFNKLRKQKVKFNNNFKSDEEFLNKSEIPRAYANIALCLEFGFQTQNFINARFKAQRHLKGVPFIVKASVLEHERVNLLIAKKKLLLYYANKPIFLCQIDMSHKEWVHVRVLGALLLLKDKSNFDEIQRKSLTSNEKNFFNIAQSDLLDAEETIERYKKFVDRFKEGPDDFPFGERVTQEELIKRAGVWLPEDASRETIARISKRTRAMYQREETRNETEITTLESTFSDK